MTRASRLIAAALACAAVFALPAASAGAETDAYSYSIQGSGTDRLGNAADVSVDNSTGTSAHDIYVTDPSDDRVEKFGPSGQFILMFGEGVDRTTGGDVCTAVSGDLCGEGAPDLDPLWPERPQFVAVDSSSGASAGDVYVASRQGIEKFEPSGQRIASWGNSGTLELSVGSITVAPDGRLFALEATAPENFLSYTSSGAYASGFLTPYDGPYGVLAADASGDFFMATSQPKSGIEKLAVSGTDLGSMESGKPVGSLAVDLPGNALYASREDGSIDRFAADCAPGSCSPDINFAQGYLSEARVEAHRIAVDSGTKAVYATNVVESPRPAERLGEVEVFLPQGELPIVTTGVSHVVLEGGAVLTGTVDPNGTGQIGQCHFEVVREDAGRADGSAQTSLVPCLPAGSQSSKAEVFGHVSGLEPGDEIHYRLEAVSPSGSAAGLTQSFVVAPKPTVTADRAINVSDTAATLSGFVGATNFEPVGRCDFQLVDATQYELSGYQAAEEVECTPRPPYSGTSALSVSAPAFGLRPRTSYRFRLVAGTAQWDSISGEGQFTTSVPEPEPEPPQPRHPQVRVPCARRACTVKLKGSSQPRIWTSPKFPAGYGWLFSLHRAGEQLPHSGLKGGCRATFGGHGIQAQLYACPDRFRLSYYGTGTFTVRWRVFEQCRCTNVNHPAGGKRRRRGAG